MSIILQRVRLSEWCIQLPRDVLSITTNHSTTILKLTKQLKLCRPYISDVDLAKVVGVMLAHESNRYFVAKSLGIEFMDFTQ